MGRRSKEGSKEVVRLILQAIESGARTPPEIARDTGIHKGTVQYYLLRKRGAKVDNNLVRQGLVRKRQVYKVVSPTRSITYWRFYLTDKGRALLRGELEPE